MIYSERMISTLAAKQTLGTKKSTLAQIVTVVMAVKRLKGSLVAVTATCADGTTYGPWKLPRSSTVRKVKHKITTSSGVPCVLVFTSDGDELTDGNERLVKLVGTQSKL